MRMADKQGEESLIVPQEKDNHEILQARMLDYVMITIIILIIEDDERG